MKTVYEGQRKECSQCEKTFSQSTHLRTHIRSVHGERQKSDEFVRNYDKMKTDHVDVTQYQFDSDQARTLKEIKTEIKVEIKSENDEYMP